LKTYGLHLHSCNLEAGTRTVTNPFTGKPIEIPRDGGLTQAERATATKLLSDVRASPVDPDGYRKISFTDGSTLSVGIGTLETSQPCIAFVVEFESLSEAVLSFIFMLAHSCNLSVGSTIDPIVVAVTQTPHNEHFRKHCPTAIVANSEPQLEAWIKKGIADETIV